MKIIVYCDPGHGWGKVSKKKLVKLGILGQISRYSYQRGNWMYLEEDCDLTLFCEAMDKAGESVEFVFNHANKQSKIRGYMPV